MSRRKCQGTNAQGEPCQSPVVDENGWCPAHGPDASERMAELGRKGAESTAKRFRRDGLEDDELPPLETPQDAERWCEIVARAVATGRISHNAGRTLARLVREFLRSHSEGEIADQVEELRSKMRELKSSGLEVA